MSLEHLGLTEAAKSARPAGSSREVQEPTGKRLLLVTDETVGAFVGIILNLRRTCTTYIKFLSPERSKKTVFVGYTQWTWERQGEGSSILPPFSSGN